MTCGAWAVGLLAWVLGGEIPAGSLLDQVVAVVDKEVITESELLTEARVALVWREGPRAALADLNDDVLAALRDYVINQTLVAAQARRQGTADVPSEDLERRVVQFKQRFNSPMDYQAFLRRFGIAALTIEDILRRDLGNDRMLQMRIRSRLLAPAEEARASAQERYEAAVKQWLEELRQGVEIRLLGPEGELELQGRH